MQHLNSHYREGGVAYEAPNGKILHQDRQSRDVGSVADRRFSARGSVDWQQNYLKLIQKIVYYWMAEYKMDGRI